MTTYYIEATTEERSTRTTPRYFYVTITKITKAKNENAEYKVILDETKEKAGHNGIWQQAVNAVAKLNEHNDLPVAVWTTTRLGHRGAYNKAHRDAQRPGGFI